MQEQPLAAPVEANDDSVLVKHLNRVLLGLDRAIDWAQR
jgi:hypothetical protein